MSTDPRYRDALSFLIEGGARLAGAAPRLAPQLSERSKDPDVERILEGVAYIVSQLERMIDARTDLLYQLAFDLIAPGYLSPYPALSTVELLSPSTRKIPAGTELGGRCQEDLRQGGGILGDSVMRSGLVPRSSSQTGPVAVEWAGRFGEG